MNSGNASGLKDSGKRVKYESGALRERARVSRFDLLQVRAIRRLATHLGRGATKYAPRNWEKGLPLDDFIDSALSHLFAFMAGDRSEDHLAAVLWNVASYIDTEGWVAEGKVDPKVLGVFYTVGGFSDEELYKQVAKPMTDREVSEAVARQKDVK